MRCVGCVSAHLAHLYFVFYHGCLAIPQTRYDLEVRSSSTRLGVCLFPKRGGGKTRDGMLTLTGLIRNCRTVRDFVFSIGRNLQRIKILLLLVLAMLSFGDVVAQGLSRAPMNPKFIEWARKQEKKKQQNASPKNVRLMSANAADSEERTLGLIPSHIDFSYLSELNAGRFQSFGTTYPSSYDLRNHSAVSSVKNQDPYGTCWAHSAMASMESWLLRNNVGSYDFSEKNMANLHGWDWNFTQGGNIFMSTAYLVRWLGPVNEATDPYPAPGTSLNNIKSSVYSPVFHVQNVRWIPPKSSFLDNDEIKDAIMKHGAIGVGYIHSFDPSCYNSSTAAYYTHAKTSTYYDYGGHMVTIVGWDDNFSKKNFATQPPGDGAYLIKNSWGTSYGKNGYFYISYYDLYFADSLLVCFADLEAVSNYKTIYQYDPLGCCNQVGYGTTTIIWGANIFTATDSESIGAVGFYAMVPNTSYTIKIYTGCSNGQPSSGTCRLTDSGITDFMGYVTIPLSSAVSVSKGEKFSVVVKFNTPQCGSPLPIEGVVYMQNDNGTRTPLTSAASAAKGQSFYGANGTTWYDLTTSDSTANVCIKAYSLATTQQKASLTSISISGNASVKVGTTAQYTCTAKYSDGSKVTVTPNKWKISSGSSYASINSSGMLTAGKVAENQNVLLQASYTEDGVTKSCDYAITIVVTKPKAPVIVSASQGSSPTSIRIDWNASTGADRYSIYRSTTSSRSNASAIESAFKGGLYYFDKTAIPGKTYWYWVKAGVGNDYSDFSSSISGWMAVPAPSNLETSYAKYVDKVTVKWDAIHDTQTFYYQVLRSTTDDGEKTVVRNWDAATSFEDRNVETGVKYYYYARAATDSNGTRAGECCLYEIGATLVPVVPERVTISGATSLTSGESANYTAKVFYSDGTSKSVTPTWTVTSGGVTSTGKLTAPTVYSNTKVTLSASYTEDGKTVRGTLDIVVSASAPSAPSTISAAAGKGVDGIAVQWGAGTGATGYTLWRSTSTSSSSAVQIATLGNVTSYTDTSATPGVDYTYWVKSVNATGMSGLSGTSATGWRKLSAPTGVAASDGAYTDKVLVSWGKVSGATHYRVSRATSASGTKTALGSWQTGLSYSDTSATAGTTYYYFVTAAMNASGTRPSDYSASDSGVRKVVITLSSIEISGLSSVAVSKTAMYGCTAKYSDGTTKSVTPTWSVSGSATISSKGLLTASVVTSDSTAIVTASFTDGTTKTATKNVKIIGPQVVSASVSDVNVYSRWPWNGWVDVDYKITASPSDALAFVSLTGQDHDLNRTLVAKSLVGVGVTGRLGAGSHRISWNVGADYPGINAAKFTVNVDVVPFELAAPVGVAASDGAYTDKVVITWDGVSGAMSYNIYRSIGESFDSADLLSSGVSQTSFSDTTAVVGTTYHYWVTAVDSIRESEFSNSDTGCVFDKKYMVIDLSGGVNATSYPISYLAEVPSGGWTDEYKTTKLILRRIPSGTFLMGSPSDEQGRYYYDWESLHQVTISKSFYIGIYEVTQKQWELVMGDNPSEYTGKARPVEKVSYDMIRGSLNGIRWPSSSDVDATSFMGTLRTKTSLKTFDLPTEAQWEYACRAGTTTALNSGKDLTGTSSCVNMDEVGRYYYTQSDGKGGCSEHTTVGSYLPNAWGLYDMHGNVCEWCLDWFSTSLGTVPVTDPVGASSGSFRVSRGGFWYGGANRCRSADRSLYDYSTTRGGGFRLCCSAR